MRPLLTTKLFFLFFSFIFNKSLFVVALFKTQSNEVLKHMLQGRWVNEARKEKPEEQTDECVARVYVCAFSYPPGCWWTKLSSRYRLQCGGMQLKCENLFGDAFWRRNIKVFLLEPLSWTDDLKLTISKLKRSIYWIVESLVVLWHHFSNKDASILCMNVVLNIM